MKIVKLVNLLMAVRCMVKAWEEVPAEVITNCFKHVGMTADEEMSMEMVTILSLVKNYSKLRNFYQGSPQI